MISRVFSRSAYLARALREYLAKHRNRPHNSCLWFLVIISFFNLRRGGGMDHKNMAELNC